jgi:homogentisate 1,2-dioxygenase
MPIAVDVTVHLGAPYSELHMKSNGYQSGFGNEFASEAIPGTLPVGRNSPQRVAHGLYAEQISGTAFTAPRHSNRRSWLYRIRPAAMHGEFMPLSQPEFHNDFGHGPVTPDQLRWSPLPLPAMVNKPSTKSIGSNGLANPRDFLIPNAAYEDIEAAAVGQDFELIAKFQGHLWRASIGHSPLDVVGWHGNHAPYKYDLRHFNTIGSISFDHPDPSIFLVLTSPTDTPGVGNLDFVIFPPRILAMQDTFRPPWFHRNIASEFMGLIHGVYDAKADGFAPGGCSLHNCMTGHGPDAATFEKASNADTSKPDYVTGTMAFMFESRAVIRPTVQALAAGHRQRDYQQCWAGLKRHFVPD